MYSLMRERGLTSGLTEEYSPMRVLYPLQVSPTDEFAWSCAIQLSLGLVPTFFTSPIPVLQTYF
jgi:hypothetical protein